MTSWAISPNYRRGRLAPLLSLHSVCKTIFVYQLWHVRLRDNHHCVTILDALVPFSKSTVERLLICYLRKYLAITIWR